MVVTAWEAGRGGGGLAMTKMTKQIMAFHSHRAVNEVHERIKLSVIKMRF